MTYLTLNLSSIPRYTTRRAWREIWRWYRIVNKRIAVETHQCAIDLDFMARQLGSQGWVGGITEYDLETHKVYYKPISYKESLSHVSP